ncbi:MAG: clostripain-related cysteine peptidase [Candidatus Hodarchaeota archaeon]
MSKNTNKHRYLIFFLIIAIPSFFIITNSIISTSSHAISYQRELPILMTDNKDQGDLNLQSPLNGGKNWTVIFYGAHDNDLSSSIPGLGSTDDIDVIALEDNIAPGDSKAAYVGTTGALTFFNLTDIHPSWIDELNMAHPDTLSIFVKFCIDNYPANHYWVVLDNHGGAYNGVCTDEGSGGDILTLGDLKTAFSDISTHLGRKVDGIFFAACLMSNLEVAVQLSPYVECIIGFETTSSGMQLDEDVVVETFVANPTMTPEEMAIELVNEATISTMGFMTMSAIKLSVIEDLIGELNTFSTLLLNNFNLYGNAIKAARDAADPGLGWYDYYSWPLLIDFVDFVEEIFNRVPNFLIRDSASNLINHLVPGGQDYAIINNRVGEASDFMRGLSVYFPEFLAPSYTGYQIGNDFCALTNWEEFLQVFYDGDVDTISTPFNGVNIFIIILTAAPYVLIGLVVYNEVFRKR